MSQDLQQIGDSHNPDDPFFNSLRDRYLEEFDSEDLSELPINYGGVVMREAEALTAQVHQGHQERLRVSYRDQDRLSEWAAFLDPYLARSSSL